jgi:flagellar biosynthesis chaperone FliJ
MEKLKERHEVALQHAEDAAEERAVDDLVTGRAGRRAAVEEVPWTE